MKMIRRGFLFRFILLFGLGISFWQGSPAYSQGFSFDWVNLKGTFDPAGDLTGITARVTGDYIKDKSFTIEFSDDSDPPKKKVVKVKPTPAPPPADAYEFVVGPPDIPADMGEGSEFEVSYEVINAPYKPKTLKLKAEVDNTLWLANYLEIVSTDLGVPGSVPFQNWSIEPEGTVFTYTDSDTRRRDVLTASNLELAYVQTSRNMFDAVVAGSDSYLSLGTTTTIAILEGTEFGELIVDQILPSGNASGTLTALPLGGTFSWAYDAMSGTTTRNRLQNPQGQGISLMATQVPAPFSGVLLISALAVVPPLLRSKRHRVA